MRAGSDSSTRSAARGVVWVLGTLLAGRLLSVASLAVLARVLAPADFGLLAFALVYITYVETVGDLGTGMALIYWPGRRADAAQVALALNLGMGLLWFALTLAAAPAVAGFFGNPAGAPVLQALAWTFPLKALGNTHDALCQKDLRFRARAGPELGAAAARATVSVTLAWAGFGVWSLVWGQLAGTALWTALLWGVVDWRPRLRWPAGLLAPMLAYGRGIVAVNVLAAVVHHADLVVVGRMMGPTALGLYHVASKVPEITISMVMWGVSRVLFPALARARTDGRPAAELYLLALRYSSLLTLPAAVALVLLAEPLVLVLFGPRWTPAAPILRALAVYAGLRSMGTQAGDVLKAAGRPGLLAVLGCVRAVLLVPALVLAARSGPVAVATMMAVVTGATMLLSVAVAGRVARVPLRDVASALRGSVLAAALVGGVLGAWTWAAGPARDPLALASALAVGGIGYLAALRLAAPEAVARIFGGGARTGTTPAALGVAGRFLVPLEGGPLRFFHRSLLVPYRVGERLARRLPPTLGARLVVRRARRPAPDADALAAELARPASPLLRGTPLEGRAGLRAIVADDGPVSGRARLLAFVFEEGAGRPAAVIKVRGAEGAGPSLRREWDALRRAADLPPSLAATVPAPLAFHERDGTEVLVQAWIAGRSAYAEAYASGWPWGKARLGRRFEDAARWLARFQASTRCAGASGPAAGPLPLSAGHGDFWARNVLWQDDRLTAVVDWEHAREQAPPEQDLFHFPLTYGLSHPWSRKRRMPPEEAFRLTFLADNAVSHAVGRYFRTYCAETGLPVAALSELFDAYLSDGWSRRPGDEARAGSRFQSMLAHSGPSVFSTLTAGRGLARAQA